MTTAKHTSTPWVIGQPEKYPCVVQVMDDTGFLRTIADCSLNENGEADAAFIVRACNSRHDSKNALTNALADCLFMMENDESGRLYGSLPDKARDALLMAGALKNKAFATLEELQEHNSRVQAIKAGQVQS